MISLYWDLIKGNHPVKRFHLLIFLFSQIKQRRNSNRLHIEPYFERNRQKTLSRLSLLTHDRKESSAYNEGEQYKSVVFNRAFPSLYKKLDEQES